MELWEIAPPIAALRKHITRGPRLTIRACRSELRRTITTHGEVCGIAFSDPDPSFFGPLNACALEKYFVLGIYHWQSIMEQMELDDFISEVSNSHPAMLQSQPEV